MHILIVLLSLLIVGAAGGQDIHHHEGATTEVDKFYSTWLQPPNRAASCCNKVDCRVAVLKRHGGKWWVMNLSGTGWMEVPEAIIEQNQSDPRESPDLRSHVCGDDWKVYCLVLGAGL